MPYMKNSIKYLITTTLIVVFFSLQAQTYSDHRAVQAHSEWDEADQSVSLHWKWENNAQSYVIYKRIYGITAWNNPIATLGATDSMYTDTDVDDLSIYEYAIEKTTTLTDPFNQPNKIKGYGYVSTAYQKPATHFRGVIGVLVTTLIQDNLAQEVDTLMRDLMADGWQVYKVVIQPTAGVAEVRDSIDFHIRTKGCNALYLLGHIPVPYSGLYCADPTYPVPPDGHGKDDGNSHCGAWASDVYYGSIYGAWTDSDSTTLGKRIENKNLIGDGKFDNIRIPGKVTIGVGRVDFSNLPALSKSEIELTRQYLNKTHQYKMGQVNLTNKGIIEDNFSSLAEGFGSGAVRDFSAILGKDKLILDDILTTSSQNDYVLAYSCGAGSYNSCAGFGTTAVFNTKNAAAFNHLFGSFFGDFDSENNILRATLASEKLGLASLWSGRPKWVTHPLALGETYGEITLKSQNNWNDYDANFFQNGTHMALMGDPSLRHFMIVPPKNIQLTTNSERNQVTVQWEPSSTNNVEGYMVFRSQKQNGGFGYPIHTNYIQGNQFIDQTPFEGNNFYQVKAVQKTTTGSGRFINLSLGAMDSISNIRGIEASLHTPQSIKISVYPTLTHQFIHIKRDLPEMEKYTLHNNLGKIVQSGRLTSQNETIDILPLALGLYHLTIGKYYQKILKF